MNQNLHPQREAVTVKQAQRMSQIIFSISSLSGHVEEKRSLRVVRKGQPFSWLLSRTDLLLLCAFHNVSLGALSPGKSFGTNNRTTHISISQGNSSSDSQSYWQVCSRWEVLRCAVHSAIHMQPPYTTASSEHVYSDTNRTEFTGTDRGPSPQKMQLWHLSPFLP